MRVGIIGAAVPSELVLAAGMVPVRISGRPRDTPRVDAFELDEVDPPTATAFEALLEPGHRFDFVLIGADRDAQSVLFKTLRELQRIEPIESVPPFAFVDMRHLPYRTTARYNRSQLIRIRDRLGSWADVEVTDERIRDAIATVNAIRSAFADVAALRRAKPARISGTQALGLVAEALEGTPESTMAMLGDLLGATSSLPEYEGRRVYLTGSVHEDDAFYRQIESRGDVVVGEDHQRGEPAFAGWVESTNNPLDGLVEYYQHSALPWRSSSAQRASLVVTRARAAQADTVICFAEPYDDATPWDLPAIRGAVEAERLPFEQITPAGIEAT